MNAALRKSRPLRHALRAAPTVAAAALALLTFPAMAADGAGAAAADRAAGVTGAVDRAEPSQNAKLQRKRTEMMVEGGAVRGPRGYERFCRLDPRYCRAPKKRRPGATVSASPDLLRQLAAFNRSVNAEFEPGRDREIYGVSDHWTFPTKKADCEDYALAKQARLLKAGWPREALLLGVVVGEDSPFHAVLIVRTTKGEYVLDNMTDELRDWRDTGYSWVIRQSARYPERWVRILGEEAQSAQADSESGSTRR